MLKSERVETSLVSTLMELKRLGITGFTLSDGTKVEITNEQCNDRSLAKRIEELEKKGEFPYSDAYVND